MSLMETARKFKLYWNWSRFRRNVAYLMKNDVYDEIYKLKNGMIEDCVYELDEAKRILPQMKIFSSRETIELLRKEPRSFARFGDGEIEVMKGGRPCFRTTIRCLRKS